MNSTYENLIKKYPLPPKWGEPKVFEDSLNVANLNLKMIGISIEDNPEILLTGSAVELGSSPWERAYFELLERGYLIEAEKTAKTKEFYNLPVYNSSEACLGSVNGIRLFRLDPINERWRYSKSNGVAIQLGFWPAAQSAGWELLERDRFLRFWYSRRSPTLISRWQDLLTNELMAAYEVNAYSFAEPSDTDQGINVVGIFGFPKSEITPFIMGLGAGATQEIALKKAMVELYQKLAFLWGESIPDQIPLFNTNPQYHLDYYSCPKSWPYLKNWLNGNLISRDLNFRAPSWQDIFFVKLDLPSELNGIYLIKAISNHNIPLTFGIGNPKIPFAVEGQEAIHPIA
jgi:hypothetical protein